MSAKTGIFLGLASICLFLLPAVAAAQGSIGPLQEPFGIGGDVTGAAGVGSLAYFTTIVPPDPYRPTDIDFIRSDGTPAGTFSIDPRGPLSNQGFAEIGFVASLGDLLFFTSALHSAPQDRGLWRTDGTKAGTFAIAPGLNVGRGGGVMGGRLFFTASPQSESPDFELWVTDGTPGGTRLVKDVNPAGASNPRGMTLFGGKLFFVADTPQGQEIWRSDGTPEGTERVLDLHDGGSGSLDLFQAGGALFILEHLESVAELWRSDGTEAGTERVVTLPQRLYARVAAGRHLFLALWSDQGREIWAVDTVAGTAVRVLHLDPSPIAQEIQMTAVGDDVAFSLQVGEGWELWWSDGTPEGTHPFSEVCPGPCSASLAGVYRGRGVLWLDDGASGSEPWLTDGTAAGTWRLGDLCPGECSSGARLHEVNGWLVMKADRDLWFSDGSRDAAWRAAELPYSVDGSLALADRLLFYTPHPARLAFMMSLPVTAPAPQTGAWMESASVPGFRFKVQVDGKLGRQEPSCMARTLCASGAVPGRSEVFLRVAGPKSNGRLWSTMVKLTPSAAEVWVQQTSTGTLRHYRLNGSGPNGSTLTGILDRAGFLSASTGLEAAVEEAAAPRDPQPPGKWIDSKGAPGFRVQARLTSNGKSQMMRKEPCIAETFCLSGALPGTTELLVRVAGPKPNRYYWPMMARFTPATLEVWIQQGKRGKVRYYRLNASPASSSQIDGYVDRQGFKQ